jgi:hypothetical protein
VEHGGRDVEDVLDAVGRSTLIRSRRVQIDATPPELGLVSITNAVGARGAFINQLNQLSIWVDLVRDNETALANVEVAVGTFPGDDDAMAWAPLFLTDFPPPAFPARRSRFHA